MNLNLNLGDHCIIRKGYEGWYPFPVTRGFEDGTEVIIIGGLEYMDSQWFIEVTNVERTAKTMIPVRFLAKIASN